jgi:hypothetical protein
MRESREFSEIGARPLSPSSFSISVKAALDGLGSVYPFRLPDDSRPFGVLDYYAVEDTITKLSEPLEAAGG